MDPKSIGGLGHKSNGKSAIGSDASRFLTFSLNSEQYAVPLLNVKEVIALTETTPVPYSPAHFKGIMNLRGQVISVIDLRMKLKMPKGEVGAETAIIILDLSPLSLGVIVDSVESVLAVVKDEIQPPPDVGGKDTSYIKGVARKDKALILILDIEKTLSVEDLKAMKSQSAA